MRVLIFMCGEGLGHTSRCISVGMSLKESGVEVSFGAYGYSRELVEKSGFKAFEIPSEIKLVGSGGTLNMMDSVEATIKNAQILGGPKVLKMISDISPDLVISDSYYLGALASKASSIPVHMIINQSNMEEFFKNRGVPLRILGELAKGFYNKVFEHMDGIIIPDFPPPYTICKHNLRFTESMMDKIFYTGPLVRKRPESVDAEEVRHPHILSMVGGFGYREKIFRNILEASKIDSSIHYTLVSGPSVKIDPKELPDNVRVLPFIEDPFPILKAADAVIAPGGHSTIMEAMSYGKPILSIPDMLHSEQENNATAIQQEGLGKRLSYHTPPTVILECVREMLEERRYASNTQRLARIAKELDGPNNLRKHLNL